MTTLDIDAFAALHNATTPDQLFYHLRRHYADHRQIATLASTTLIGRDPELLDLVEERLALYFLDLGNSFQDTWQGVGNALGHRSRLTTCPTTDDLAGRFAGMPAVVLGAGPSVDPCWDAIAAARQGAILFVVDAMVRPCLARGIRPDFVCAVERLPDVYDCMAGLDKSGMALIAPVVVEPRLIDDFGGRVIWAWRACLIEQWIDPGVRPCNTGHSSGTVALAAAALAGCDPIHLVGHDLCMQGAATHCATADSMVEMTADHLDRDQLHIRTPATNWKGDPVITIPLWELLKADLEHTLSEHPDRRAIVAGDGLAIRGTTRGSLPATGWKRLPRRRDGTLAMPRRRAPGADVCTLFPQIRQDCDALEKVCRDILAAPGPDDAERLRLSRIVPPSTVILWSELLQNILEAALVRLHLQPWSTRETHHHVAITVLTVIDILRQELPHA
jgi:hypothetical protein